MLKRCRFKIWVYSEKQKSRPFIEKYSNIVETIKERQSQIVTTIKTLSQLQ